MRAGVTRFGGLATTVLADTMACFLSMNQECLDGTLTVVEALKGDATASQSKANPGSAGVVLDNREDA